MSGRRPQPVLTAAQASAAATWLTALGVAFLARHGLLVPDEVARPVADLVAVGIVGVVGAVSSLIAGLVARAKVTPTADPRDDEGRPLAPVRVQRSAAPPLPRPAPAARPVPAPSPPPPSVPGEPATDRVPVVDIAALRREYDLD